MAFAVRRGEFLAFVLLLGSTRVFAQTTGELTGRVMDSTNVPIAGALVEVKSPALIRPRQTGTDKEGRYRFQLLPPGTYEVMARMTGFVDAIRTDIRIPLGETITVPMTLTVTATASVEVDTTPPLLDVENAKAGITVNQKVLQNLPLGRNYTALAALVPGTGTDVLGPTFYGASSLENSYQTDGINTTAIQLGGQGKKIPLEFIQDVEIRSGGYEAEYGKALGGNINVLTKSGGPGFRGGVFGYYASDSLGAADEHEADRKVINSPTLEVPVQSDAGFNLGGPLLRDRIWFFGAYDRLSKVQDYRAIDHVTFSETGARQNFYEDRTDRTLANLFALNFSWMPASSQSVSLSIFGDPSSGTTRSDANPGPAYATTTEKITGGTDVSARWTGFFGAFIAEVQYGYHEEDGREVSEFQNRPVFFDIRNGVFQLVEGSGAWTTNEHWRLVDATYRRNSLQLSGSVNLGAHELKAGALHELQNPNRTARISGGEVVFNYYLRDGSYDGSVHEYFASAPLNCTKLITGQTGNFGYVNPVECLAWQKTDAVRSDARSRNLSVFVQDSWRPFSNLTLKAGLRYDQQEIYASGGAQGLTLKDQWSPRLSIAWDPAGNGRVKAFGSYGRYYQAFPIYVQGRFYSGESVAYVVNDSRGVDPVGTWEAGLESPVYVPGDLKGMFQDEITLGVEVEAMKSLAVGLRGVYRSLGRALEDRCDRDDPIVGSAFPPDGYGKCAFVNPGYGALGQYRDPANPDCFEDFPVNTIPAPCESVRASRIHRGLELTVQYRPAKDLYAMASYVYSKLEGNYDGLIFHGGAGGQQVEPGLGGAFDYTAGLPNNFGRLPGDRTHQVKLSGSYTLPFGLTAGVMGQFWTGEPLSIYGWSSVLYSGQVKADRFLEPRGSSGEMPSTYSIDLHLHYDWRIGSVTVTPAVDIFNLTNVQPALSRWTMYNTPATISNDKPPYTNPTNPRFGRDVTWQRPRLIQLGLKAAF